MTPENSKIRIICVVGARPNFMKIAPIIRAFSQSDSSLLPTLVHTGQHYDAAMKESFFHQLKIPEPDIDLGVGSGTHATQTAEIMKSFESVVDDVRPGAVLVVGDVNSTIACALVAAKKGISVIHVEAGLRSGDRTMPEEINRVLTDQISDLLFTTEKGAEANLLREGVSRDRIHFVGNVMIDTLLFNLGNAVDPAITLKGTLETVPTEFGLLTLHRPSNVDNPATLEKLLQTLKHVSSRIPLIFPVHPRTKKSISDAGLDALLASSQIIPVPPLGYLEMLGLMKAAKLVLTDSGGVQEETTALGVPCLTLRENTERPITVEAGTNTIVGRDPDKIMRGIEEIISFDGKKGRIPELWDGRTAERIAAIIGRHFSDLSQ